MIKPLLANDWLAFAILGCAIVVCVVIMIFQVRAGMFKKDGDE